MQKQYLIGRITQFSIKLSLFRRTPKFYAITYLLLIPVFALLYYINQEGMYQSTIKNEGIVEVLEKQLSSLVSDFLLTKTSDNKSKFLSHNGKYQNISKKMFEDRFHVFSICRNLGVNSVENANEIELLCEYEIVGIDGLTKVKPDGTEYWEVYTAKNMMVKIPSISLDKLKDIRYDFSTISKKYYSDGVQYYPLNITINHHGKDKQKINKDNFNEYITKIFPAIEIQGDGYQVSVDNPEVEQKIVTSLIDYIYAKEGTPTSAGSSIIRMFYFSIVTITTLGYGDIVPITDTARILVSLESLFGIVLIGLFLNSLPRGK